MVLTLVFNALARQQQDETHARRLLCAGRGGQRPLIRPDPGPRANAGGERCTIWLQKKRDAVANLCRQYDVSRLEIFGSGARVADFDPATSDLDFLVEFRPESHIPALQQIFGFAEVLEKLFDRRTSNLVQPGAFRNPYLLADINRSREIVHAS